MAVTRRMAAPSVAQGCPRAALADAVGGPDVCVRGERTTSSRRTPAASLPPVAVCTGTSVAPLVLVGVAGVACAVVDPSGDPVDDPELHAARKTTTASTTSPADACPPAVLAAAPDPQIADAAGPRLGQPCRLPASSGCPHCRDRDSPSPFSRPNDLSRVLAAEREHQPRGQMRFPRAVPGRGPAPRGPDPGPLRISVTLGRPAGSGVRRIVCRYLCQLTASRGRCRLAGDGPRRGRWPPRAEACRACRSGLPSHKCRRSAPGPTPEFSGRGQDGRVLLMLPSCHGRKTA